MTINYAHRGASGYYPENTMIAFEKAIELGCDGIETDVQMTKDGILVLIHDETVKRTTGKEGWVKDYTYEELKNLNAANYFGLKDSFHPIPKAEDLLALAKKHNILVNYEIKTGIVFYPGIEGKLIQLIKDYNMENNVIISSFNHYALVDCNNIAPEIKTAILYGEGLYHPERYCKDIGAMALHPAFYTITSEIVRDAHREGLIIQPYTVNDEDTMKRLISLGVDGIITNYPDKLKKYCK